MRLLDNVVARRSPPRSIKMDDAGASHLNYARKDTTRLTPIAPLSYPAALCHGYHVIHHLWRFMLRS